MQINPWLFTVTLACVTVASSEYLMGGHMDNSPPKSLLEQMESSPSLARTAQLDDLDLDLNAEESTAAVLTSDDEETPRYHLPYPFAFNGGRPFSLEKDPITGKIDFEKAPPVKALNLSTRYQEHVNEDEKHVNKNPSKENGPSYLAKKKVENSKETDDVSPNEINPYSPNFHDFLNLPVHYSSDKYGKDKYPLISSSYANTKVQSGSNSYSTYNHKPYHGETVMYYPTRKPYMPKTTSITTTTTTTTPRPTPSTTPSTTTTSTTPRLTTIPTTTTTVTTTTSTTTTPRPQPSTAASTSTKAPVVTTWKPPVSTPKRFVDHLDDYDDILPIEKLQSSVYASGNQGPNNIVQHNGDPQTKPPTKHEEYIDSYEDYEIGDGEDAKDYVSMKEATSEAAKTNTFLGTTSAVPNITTTIGTTETTSVTTTSTSTSTSTVVPSSSTMYSSPVSQESSFQSNSLPFQVHSPRPVTSVSLDSEHRVPLVFESDNRRHGITDNIIINQAYRPNQRPSGLGNGILVESTSNIVIPPDQDTVSFVLGNRQNVEGGYYSLGTAIGENPYAGSTGIDASFRPLYGVSPDKGNYDPQSDYRGTIGLPSVSILENNPSYAAQTWTQSNPTGNQKLANEVEPSKTQSSFVKGSVFREQPEDKKEDKDVNYVVFPKDEPKQPVIEEHIVVINEADGTVHELTPSSTTLKPVRVDPPATNEEHLPQLSENLTPPAERPKPPPQFYYHYHHGGMTVRPDHPRPQRLPLPPRGKQPPSPSLPPPSEPIGIRRRPYSPDSNLPNILPQFRPNAKTSHGHRGSEAIGTIAAGQGYPTRVRPPVQSYPPTSRRPLLPPPSYLQRLNPPPPPIHVVKLAGVASTKSENVVPPRDAESTVKRFRLPSVSATSRGEDDVKLAQRVSNQKLRLEEEERSERYSEEPPQVPPRPPLFPKRRTADPSHVATLQMIQQHGEFEEDATEPSLSSMDANANDDESDRIVTEQNADRRKFDSHEPMAEPPVYVVYPVNTAVNIHPDDSREKDESVVVGTRGPHRPLPPETLLQDNEDQEMNEEPRPVHNVFNGRPVVSDFPYPLERPDPSILVNGMRETPLLVPSDQRQEDDSTQENTEEKDEKDSSVNVIPYLQDFVPFPARKNEVISATLHRLPALPSSTPIAYVYTPTAQASHRLDMDVRDEDISKTEKNDQKPVLLPSQQPSSSSSSAPSPQNFMAPFVASISAEAPSKNGWSVVVVEPTINRKSDDNLSETTSNADETQTEKAEFDAENFKPQLFGGFKPIYEFPAQNEHQRPERRESNDSETEMSTHLQVSGNSTV